MAHGNKNPDQSADPADASSESAQPLADFRQGHAQVPAHEYLRMISTFFIEHPATIGDLARRRATCR